MEDLHVLNKQEDRKRTFGSQQQANEAAGDVAQAAGELQPPKDG
jgi:hypothetical protein